MNESEKRGLCIKIFRHFGEENQIFKAIEELAELSAALSRYMSATRQGNTSSREWEVMLSGLYAEMADVEIMLQQLNFIFESDELDSARSCKWNRLASLVAPTPKESAIGKVFVTQLNKDIKAGTWVQIDPNTGTIVPKEG